MFVKFDISDTNGYRAHYEDEQISAIVKTVLVCRVDQSELQWFGHVGVERFDNMLDNI